MKKPTKKYMRGGMATADSRVPLQAGAGMARAAMGGQRGQSAPAAPPMQRAAQIPNQAVAGMARRPIGMKKGGKIDGAAMRGKTKGRKC